MTYTERLQSYQKQIEEGISEYLVYESCKQKDVIEAMLYSALAGGKRIRPVLLLEFCRLSGGKIKNALPFAIALEFIHTYSLIHDDLPCMDNDDLRRGKPTNHRVFGEGMAVLAGDGLLNLAFETVLKPENSWGVDPATTLCAAYELAFQSGIYGMIGGQTMDMAEWEDGSKTLDDLKETHRLKTGALLKAATRIGVMIGGGSAEQLEAATIFGEKIGLAFQIRDDLLDVIGDVKTLGKRIGSDMDYGKETYVDFLSADQCKKEIDKLSREAIDALSCFKDNDFLMEFAEELSKRSA